MKKLLSNLTFQVLIAIVLGIVVGLEFKQFATSAKLISDTFIKMITPGRGAYYLPDHCAGHSGDERYEKGRQGRGQSFIILRDCYLLCHDNRGYRVANIIHPGDGVVAQNAADATKLAVYQKAAADMHWVDFITHIVPSNAFDAFAKGDILQILFFAVLFGFGLSFMGESGQQVVSLFDKLSKVFFNIMRIIMRVAQLALSAVWLIPSALMVSKHCSH